MSEELKDTTETEMSASMQTSASMAASASMMQTITIEAPATLTKLEVKAEQPSPTLMQKVMNIVQANTIIESMNLEKNSLQMKLQESDTNILALKKTNLDYVGQIESYKNQMALQKSEFEKQIAGLNVKVTDESKSVDTKANMKAIKILADSGINIEDTQKVMASTKTRISPEAKLEQYKNMSNGPEKNEYYAKNRMDIIHATNAKALETIKK